MKAGATNVIPIAKVCACVFLKLLNHAMFMRVDVYKPKKVTLLLEWCIVVVLLLSRFTCFNFILAVVLTTGHLRINAHSIFRQF